ncbi:MAG TPA: LytTR family DNA-binding domain-containing protein, partial [Solirubrobacteraceae bacterium]
ALTRLARLLGATGRVDVAGRAGDAAEARAALDRVGADVVFLDIHMPGMSGLELAAHLPPGVAVVFTTAYDQHALAAFEANAVDYLLKPIERKRLDRALDKLERLRDDPARADTRAMLGRLAAALRVAPAPFADRLPFRTRDGIQLLDVATVTHFIARDRLTHAVTSSGDHVVDFGLAELEAKLDPAKFLRIHRAALLTLDHVAEIQPWPGGRLLVRLKGAARTELEVSRDRVRALKERLGL